MAIIFAWIVLTSLLSLIAMQSIFVFRYFALMSSKVVAEAIDFSPKTAVILCLRGGDPTLEDCLESLVAQTYPNFELHLVFDDKQDPALKIAKAFFEKTVSELVFQYHFLSHEIAETCSLKNQAIISAVSEADDSIEIFALVDADGVVEPDWLMSLIQPLANHEVGATTGNRWFAPSNPTLGSLFRQAWNAAALPQMSFYNIAWGGSLAIKRTTITQCDLLDLWSNAFCEDTMMAGVLKSNGLKLVSVVSVIVPSQESTTLSAALAWVSRQLLTVRLHHKSWPLVLVHAFFSFACLWGAIFALVVLYFEQEYFALGRLALVLLAYLIGNVLLLQVIQMANGRLFVTRDNQRKKTIQPMSPGQMLVAAVITQLLYPIAVLRTVLMKKISWRGIEYSIGPGKQIRMIQYRPYRECQPVGQTEASID